jgi:asparagine synthase (glutamine-hydrolysing)
MCGIAGFSGGFDEGLLSRMGAAIAHRGPDDAGVCFVPEHRIGLAHRRLSIIDLSPGGHQPMWSDGGSVAITFNGEIYNYRELRKELTEDGFAFRSQSDTEVLLQLYLRDGLEMLERLNGIFAFAIWDKRSRTLFLARDHLGVKPLYYAHTASGLLFASELKALLCSPAVDRTLDLPSVDRHLHYLWNPSPFTMLRSVKKLEPGCALLVREGRIERSWRYYDLPYDQTIVELGESEAVARLHDTLSSAIHRQMVADVPVGAFLSGGLDSSCVAAYAREEVSQGALRCFTIGFKDDAAVKEGMGQDLPYARRVAQHLGVPLETVWVGPEMVRELPRMVFHLDEPQNDPAPINALLICGLARQHGIKVLLSGAGGDDIFTGYRRHAALLREGTWSWLPRPMRRLLRATVESLPMADERLRRLAKAFRYADLEGDHRLVSYFFHVPPGVLWSLYSRELRDALDATSAADPLLAALARLPGGVPELNRMLYLEGKFFLADHNLNYADKMAMAHGVEVRVPLIDIELVKLAACLPPHLKQRGSTGKWIFRKAMEPILPREVIYRKKAGFGAPLRHWIRGPLRPLVEDALSARTLEARGLFDAARVKALVEKDRAGRVDAAYAIFGMICIELWCRMFVDPPVPTPIELSEAAPSASMGP